MTSIRPKALSRIALTLFILADVFRVCFAAELPPPVTVVFQNGVNGYTSERDATISTQSAEFTEGNGNTTTDANVMVWRIEYETRGLIRFDNLNLPPGAEVKSATLDLVFDNFDSGFTVAGFYVQAPWNPLATGNQGLGWLHRDTGLDWDAPGAGGLGSDVLIGKGFSISDFPGSGHDLKSIVLDPDIVQTWVSSPIKNQGVLLINTAQQKITRVYWGGTANIEDRPKLTIVYQPGIPPTVSQAASANPNPVGGSANTLSVLGADDNGEQNLTYTWSAIAKPAGAPDPVFSPNGNNAAKQSTTTYGKTGLYQLQAVIQNRGGLAATSAIPVTVSPVFSTVAVSPPSAKILTNATLLFSATASDQFGDPLPTQPVFTWTVGGGGSIDANGLFAAGATPGGPFVVRAAVGLKNGTALVTVRLPNKPPLVSLTSPIDGQQIQGSPITGWTNLLLTAEASDPDGTVAKVEFFAGDQKLGEDTTSPYSIIWSNAPPGTYQLTAHAIDEEGTVSTSAPASVTIAIPPSPVAPFFASPKPSGTLDVDLYPTEGITGERLVTFGVPFPRGSLAPNDLARIRVLRNGTEIPAHVDAIAAWRHAHNASLDETSVRVARIQIHHTPTTTWPNPERIVVEWGLNNRTLNVAAFENPRNGWHPVTGGTFEASDNISEPDILAVLPKTHLCLGLLKPARMTPLDDSVPAARENPEEMDAIEHWPDFLELHHAVHNFFFSLINQDDPRVSAGNRSPYRIDFEPWLYDRAAVMFLLYFRSGHVQALREAIRAAQYYHSKLYPEGTQPAQAVGAFKLKVPGPNDFIGGNGAMYSYNECLAYDYWLCGDEAVLPAIDWVVRAHENNDESTRWSPDAPEWTERHTAFRLLANVVAYEVFGQDSYKNRLLSQSGDFIWHQNGADGVLPSNRVDGGLYHFGRQHGDGVENSLVASSWMTVLTLDAMMRTFAVTEDPEIADFIRRLGSFWKAACKSDDQHQYDTYEGVLMNPDYMMTFDGTSDPFDGREFEMVEHGMDIGSGVAWAGYFSALLGQPDPSLFQVATNLYYTYDIGVNYWTRPAGPAAGNTAYRVSPWRKYGWEHRLSGTFPWVMAQLQQTTSRPRLDIARVGASALQLTFPGSSGAWRIESSSALSNWTTFATLKDVLSPTNFNLNVTGRAQFFRAVSP